MKREITFFTISVLSTAVMLCSPGKGMAEGSDSEKQPKTGAPITITDAAGRVHTVLPKRSITPEQRKAAAKRMKLTRDAKKKKAAPAVEGGTKK